MSISRNTRVLSSYASPDRPLQVITLALAALALLAACAGTTTRYHKGRLIIEAPAKADGKVRR